MKKILGISSGSLNGNSEILLKEALMTTQEMGAKAELIRLHDMKIGFCTGCNACIMDRNSGGDGRCKVYHDDADMIYDKILECDAFIVAAPCYTLRAPGLLAAFYDRGIGTGENFKHEIAAHPKISAIIGVGGAEESINLLLPFITPQILPEVNNKLVDQMLAVNIPRRGQVLIKDEYMERARVLARNVMDALSVPYEEAQYRGDMQETCPVCHSNLLRVVGDKVECPFCDIKGDLVLENGSLTVKYENLHRMRGSGQEFEEWHEQMTMRRMQEYEDNKKEIAQRMKKYRDFPVVKPVSKA